MKIKTLFKIQFGVGLFVTLVLSLLYLHGNHIERTQVPITDFTYNGCLEKINYRRSNSIYITYKSKQYTLHVGDRLMYRIKYGDLPKLYYSSETDYLFFEGDYMPIGYAETALLFTIIFTTVGILIWRKQLDKDIRTM